MKINYNTFLKRTLYALVIVLLLVPTFILVYYGQIVGRIIGLIIFLLIGIWGIYEICSFMTKNHFTIIGFSLVLLITTLMLPYDSFEALIVRGIASNITLKETIYFNFQWQTFVFPLISIVLFFLIDPNLRRNYHQFLQNAFILLIVSYLTPFLVKGILVINVFDWTKLVFLISIAAISDTSAYVGGSLFGKKWFKGARLAPKISPNKSWAGALIAFVVTYVFTSVVSYYINFWSGSSQQILLAFVGGIVLALVAQIGDMVFSRIKRALNTKDFSNLIPIHGGVFDRVDAISFVVFFTVILFMISA